MGVEFYITCVTRGTPQGYGCCRVVQKKTAVKSYRCSTFNEIDSITSERDERQLRHLLAGLRGGSRAQKCGDALFEPDTRALTARPGAHTPSAGTKPRRCSPTNIFCADPQMRIASMGTSTTCLEPSCKRILF
jgi:hypothetical protein